MFDKNSIASLSKSGATTTSVNSLEISLAVSFDNDLLKATIPPNALIGSHKKLFYKLLIVFLFKDTPHGFPCFKITHDGIINCSANSIAISRS